MYAYKSFYYVANRYTYELEVLAYIQSGRTQNEIQDVLLKQGFLLKNDITKPSRELLEFETKLTKQFSYPLERQDYLNKNKRHNFL